MSIIDNTPTNVSSHAGERLGEEHRPWCVVADCYDYNDGETRAHFGPKHTATLDGGGLVDGWRNDPEHDELSARITTSTTAARAKPLMIELEVDTATSGSEDVMWLTVDEAHRFAHAILAAVADATAAER